MNFIKYLFLVLLVFTINFYASGNLNNFELGTAIYKNLSVSSTVGWHWHTGLFNYFIYDSGTGIGYMNVAHVSGSPLAPEPEIDYVSHSISVTDYENDLLALKSNFKEMFREGVAYYGAYDRIITPSTRASIVASAQDIAFANDIGYTSNDMIDANNVWCWDHWWYCEHWNGNRSNIDEIRCDGLVEYSYEKNGIIVCKAYNLDGSRSSSHDNIANAGQDNLDYHNDLHNGNFNWHEMCPRIQSGNDDPHQDDNDAHNSNSETVSNFAPLVSAPPSSRSFSITELTNTIQLNFIVGDNASLKAYVLVQVKKTNESNWHVLVDENNNTWQFKGVDLVGWNSLDQHTYLHVPWVGNYVGGQYSIQEGYFDLKITLIDQGANYSISYFGFSIPQVPPTPIISMSGGIGDNPTLTFSGGGVGVDYYVLKKEYDFGSGFGASYVNPSSNPYTDNNVQITRFGGDLIARYSVKVVDVLENESNYSNTVSTDGQSLWKKSNEQENEIIKEYSLEENFPNPFNPTTKINYQLPKNSFVNLIIYNSLGQIVTTLINQYQPIGKYSVQFNAYNLPSGVYIYKLQADEFSSTRKMMLTK